MIYLGIPTLSNCILLDERFPMKLTSKFAVSALVLALSATTAFAASTTQALVDQVAKVNQLTSDLTKATNMGIDAKRFEILSKIVNDEFMKLSEAEKTAKVTKAYETYKNIAETGTSENSKKIAQEYSDALQDVKLVLQQADAIYTQKNASKNLPLEQDLFKVQLAQQPILESHNQVRVANALDTQLNLELLNQVQAQGNNQAFVLYNGVSATGDELTAGAHQVALGYKFNLPLDPQFTTNVAVFGDVGFASSQRDLGKLQFQTKHNPAYGFGAYADLAKDGFKGAALLGYSVGSANVTADADYSAIVAKLTDEKYRNELASAAQTSATAKANTSNFNFLVKGGYEVAIAQGVTLTPSLFYQYHGYNASKEEVTAKNAPATLEFSKTTPFVPSLSTHGLGGSVDVQYVVDGQFTVGADATLGYYTTGAVKQPTASIVAKDVTKEDITVTEYSVAASTQDKSVNYLAFATNAKVTYKLHPQFTLQGKVGYLHVSELQQGGFTYGVSLGAKF